MPPLDVTESLREIQNIADHHYGGRTERGFLHWALGCVLADTDPTEEELIAHTALDGSGDLGIDGYWVDEANNRLIFLQSKDQQRIRREDALAFRESIESLIDQDYVHRHGNAAINDIYPDLFELLIDETYSVHAVLACGGRIPLAARTYASREGSRPWIFDFGEATRRKDVQLQVFDVADLASLKQALVAAAIGAPELELPVVTGDGRSAYHHMGGIFRAIEATVPARAIAEAYGRYRSAIFRHNPRGPLGSNKVNREIEQSLRDATWKSHFHLLNNGLTVVCDSVHYDEDRRALQISNFQIVNGCQTAFTLHSLRDLVTDDVLVGVRIIEGLHNLASVIAKSTNSQTAVRPEQLASLGPEHDVIKERFDRLPAPWFYEKQQGSTRFQSQAERQIHRSRYANRSVTVKDVGQYAAAFVGHPILAKYDLKVLFERSEAVGQRLYNAIFLSEKSAEQQLLPVLIGRKVDDAQKQRVASLRAQLGERQEAERFSEIHWLPYARMHLVALIGEVVRVDTPEQTTDDKFLTPVESRSRLATLDDWFSEAFQRARQAVHSWIQVERRADRLANLREFFRSQTLYSQMADTARQGW